VPHEFLAVYRQHGRAAGWSVGVIAPASLDGSGRVVWQVDGRNGENLIRTAGATEAEARGG
jgi:hypothetical protein